MSSQNDKKKKKMNKAVKAIIITVSVIVALALAAGATALIMYNMGKSSMKNTPPEDAVITTPDDLEDVVIEQDGATVYYNGEKYEYNENAVPILLLGADKYSFVSLLAIDGRGEIRHGGVTYPISAGDSYYLPAGMGEFSISSEGLKVLLSSLS